MGNGVEVILSGNSRDLEASLGRVDQKLKASKAIADRLGVSLDRLSIGAKGSSFSGLYKGLDG